MYQTIELCNIKIKVKSQDCLVPPPPSSKRFTLTINGAFDLSIMENMSVMEEPVAFLIFRGGLSLG